MKKIFIFKFDPKTGPKLLIQYPPEKNIPSKELLLQIWAQYELKSKSILFEVRYNNSKFLVIGKSQNKEIFFIVLQLTLKEKSSIFQDTFVKLSNTLFSEMGKLNFPRIIADSYKTLNEFSVFNKNQLYFNFFSDIDKINLLKIFRNGVIDRSTLVYLFKEEYGISESNLDLILTPFFNLNLIVEKTLPGIKNCYFLVNDVFFCRIPSKKFINKLDPDSSSSDKMYLVEIKDFFQNYSIENEEDVYRLSKILNESNVFNAFEKLFEKKMKESEFLSYLIEDYSLLSQLKQENLIIEIEDYIYPVAELKFIQFKPIFLIKTLTNRFKKKEISIEQFISHINLLNKKNKKKRKKLI
ncbi:MAG: hypothetical protein ACTSRZ_15570 [Promethearchaeota archaeon]